MNPPKSPERQSSPPDTLSEGSITLSAEEKLLLDLIPGVLSLSWRSRDEEYAKQGGFDQAYEEGSFKVSGKDFYIAVTGKGDIFLFDGTRYTKIASEDRPGRIQLSARSQEQFDRVRDILAAEYNAQIPQARDVTEIQRAVARQGVLFPHVPLVARDLEGKEREKVQNVFDKFMDEERPAVLAKLRGALPAAVLQEVVRVTAGSIGRARIVQKKQGRAVENLKAEKVRDERDEASILSPQEVSERVQKETQRYLLEEYTARLVSHAQYIQFVEESIKREGSDMPVTKFWEWEKHKVELKKWKAAALRWFAQNPNAILQWKKVPPDISEEDRGQIEKDAIRDFRANKNFIETELQRYVSGKRFTDGGLQDAFVCFHVDRYLAKSESRSTQRPADGQDILNKTLHFPDFFHYIPTGDGQAQFLRLFRQEGALKRIDFPMQNPFVIFQDHGGRQEFIIHTVDEKDPREVLRTENLSVPFASAEKEYAAKPGDPTWEARRQLIRDLLTTPLENWGLFSVLNVTNFFRFHMTSNADAVTIGHFPFDMTKLFLDARVTNKKFFLERLFEWLWWMQTGGVTPDDCTFIKNWFEKNIGLFGEGVDAAESDAGERAMTGLWPNENGVYAHTDSTGNTVYVTYYPKEGWYWKDANQEKWRKIDDYPALKGKPEVGLGPTGAHYINSNALSVENNAFLDHVRRSLPWEKHFQKKREEFEKNGKTEELQRFDRTVKFLREQGFGYVDGVFSREFDNTVLRLDGVLGEKTSWQWSLREYYKEDVARAIPIGPGRRGGSILYYGKFEVIRGSRPRIDVSDGYTVIKSSDGIPVLAETPWFSYSPPAAIYVTDGGPGMMEFAHRREVPDKNFPHAQEIRQIFSELRKVVGW